jgi:hypothetical protein
MRKLNIPIPLTTCFDKTISAWFIDESKAEKLDKRSALQYD